MPDLFLNLAIDMETKYTEKLSRLLFIAACFAVAIFALKYFGTVIGYILLGFVIALISKPLTRLLRKIKIKGKSAPDALLAFVSIFVIISVLCGIITILIPVMKNVALDISMIAAGTEIDSLSVFFNDFNQFLIQTFDLEDDFRLEVMLMNELSTLLNPSFFSNVIGTVASTFVSIFIGLFAVTFIAFFLIKDETMFTKIVSSFTPGSHSDHIVQTINGVEQLLSRYFVGLISDMSCVGLMNFLGLWAIARLDFESALGIGFLAGILNIIPYIGPISGCVLGTLMGTAIKFCSEGVMTMNMEFGISVLILASIFIVTQILDMFLLQPLIYSTSIKAYPLEIFLVILISGSIAGPLGMIVAIPSYTVFRVIAINFFPDSNYVKNFIKN